ncbi:MAG TPA: peptidase M61 [Croceibacterium sp.]|nr:peptidase M61 [Croceibacterium sp.]
MTNCRAVAPLFAALSLAAAGQAVFAQPAVRSAPTAVAAERTINPARDVPYPGTIGLDIDATDIDRAIFRVKQTIPVPSGQQELVLQLPEWLPGKHAARGAMNLIAGVTFEVDGQAATWTRDPIETYAFRIPLPDGAREVTARFVYTSPLRTTEGRIVVTQEMMNLQWEAMSLYPAGYYVRQIPFRPTVTFPQGWEAYTALDGMERNGDTVTWATVDYETLVDSPIFAGKYARRWDLGHDVYLSTVADKPGQLELKPEHLATFEKLVDESLALFGARHFDHYDILLALTDRMGGIGLEHHRSSENDYAPDTFIKWDELAWNRNVVSHEIAHSWNGKYRRPEALWTPDYRQPMQDNLLWMYEGQDQFWGWVLAARSGLQPKDIVLGAIANSAGAYSVQPGRAWRSVEDTTHDPIINARRPVPYSTYSRSEDYYSEGMLVWLEADQIIREGTRGRKGLDDFASAFFGMNDGDWGVLTYDFDEIVETLNGIHPYDWATFLHERFQTPGQPAPITGVEKAGYRLTWKEEPNPYEKGRTSSGAIGLQYSLGVSLTRDGTVSSVLWDSPAFNAGVVNGAQIVAVNGEAYSADTIKQAITAAKGGSAPIDLLIKRGQRYFSVPVAYHDGLRWPWLEPAGSGKQPLDRLLDPRT